MTSEPGFTDRLYSRVDLHDLPGDVLHREPGNPLAPASAHPFTADLHDLCGNLSGITRHQMASFRLADQLGCVAHIHRNHGKVGGHGLFDSIGRTLGLGSQDQDIGSIHIEWHAGLRNAENLKDLQLGDGLPRPRHCRLNQVKALLWALLGHKEIGQASFADQGPAPVWLQPGQSGLKRSRSTPFGITCAESSFRCCFSSAVLTMTAEARRASKKLES